MHVFLGLQSLVTFIMKVIVNFSHGNKLKGIEHLVASH